MPSRLNPYISFSGDAKQALEFYEEVFGGNLAAHTYGDSMSEAPPGHGDKVMHGMLETTSGFTLMASDNPPGMERTAGNNITVSLSGDEADELRGYWNKLSAGGTVTVPLEKQMWGDVFGMCTDKFGIPWMVNITERQA
ncbi:VOC family protein [Streptomyces actinomycinicus]|uniref:VOC family protein n=1 Tax=Streptomyces actinomycinicus TaxID=1695166 RepID=A0A937JN45_9ACTN|nr:VOC family protein [Streptomyces actinomycinicus]MBL1081088.1 VOC family protein [Streptomyces actinomycinicus]